MGSTPLRSNQGDHADIPSLRSRYVLRSDDTGGRFAVIEHVVPPHRLAAPMHTHHNEDEFSYVLAGRIGVRLGEDTFDLGPGDSLLKPRGVPHAFWNSGDVEAVLTETISPGGFDQYFTDLAPALTGAQPDFELMGRVQAQYELEMDITSIEELCRRYHLQP